MEIVLFINDLQPSPIIEKDLDMISFDPKTSQLCIDYVWVGPNGSGDGMRETLALEAPITLLSLYEVIDDAFDHLLEIADLLLNTRLIDYFLNEHNDETLKEIDQQYIMLLQRLYRQKESEDDFVDLAILCQAYGAFLERYDFSRCADPYRREKDLLEDVASHHPTDENIHNAIVGYNDVIRIYEALGDAFQSDTLALYLALYDLKKRAHEVDDYDFAHICERIGILYSEIDTNEDMDGIDHDADRLRMSIFYHQIEKDIFREAYHQSHGLEEGYNYNVALRQIGRRFEALGDKASLLEAQTYYKQAYTIAQTLHQASSEYEDLYTISLEHLGDIYLLLSKPEAAIQAYLEVFAIEQQTMAQLEDRFSVVIINKKLGKAYQALREYQQAQRYYQDALTLVLEVAKESDDYEKQAECGISYMNLGWLAMDQKKYDEALSYFQKDLSLRLHLNERYGTITSHYSLSLAQRHMGYVLEALGDEEKACLYFKSCVQIALHYCQGHHEGQRHYLMVSLHDLAYCHFQLGNYALAKEGYDQVLAYLAEKSETRVHEYVLDEKAIKQEYEALMKLG